VSEGTRADVEVLVVGAGVSGLAAARQLEGAGRDVLVVDSGDAPGGVIGSERHAGYLVERAANTILLKPPLAAFLAASGLDAVLERAAPASRKRALLRDGELIPVPLGPLDLLRSPLLSSGAKWRLLREPFVARGHPETESVAEFVARRLGDEVVRALVGPFLTGVYAGDEFQLAAEAVFPSLVEHERRRGSITLGALAGAFDRKAPRGLPGTWSARGGLGELVRGMAEGLRRRPQCGTTVLELAADGDAWRASLRTRGREETLRARCVVIATPAYAAAELLRSHVAEAAGWLASLVYSPMVSLALGVRPEALRTRAEGFGFLVPRAEGLGLLGCLFMSELFGGRAPEGRQLLQAMLGGTRSPELVEQADDALTQQLFEELDTVLGLREEPERIRIQRWPRAVPQPAVGHNARVASLRRDLRARAPGLALVGNYLDGVSVADSIACGLRVESELD
jgi:oxygen-dependent protoporphyrinogen oxidase